MRRHARACPYRSNHPRRWASLPEDRSGVLRHMHRSHMLRRFRPLLFQDSRFHPIGTSTCLSPRNRFHRRCSYLHRQARALMRHMYLRRSILRYLRMYRIRRHIRRHHRSYQCTPVRREADQSVRLRRKARLCRGSSRLVPHTQHRNCRTRFGRIGRSGWRRPLYPACCR